MGMDQHIYIGPYLRIREKVMVDRGGKGKTCSDQDCVKRYFIVRDRDAERCSKCGVVLETRHVPQMEFVKFDILEFQEKHGMSDDFCSGNGEGGTDKYAIIIPNNTRKLGGIKIGNDSCEIDLLNEFSFSDDSFTPPWQQMLKLMDDNGVKYDKCAGVVSYWS